jgi:hypothetical protein
LKKKILVVGSQGAWRQDGLTADKSFCCTDENHWGFHYTDNEILVTALITALSIKTTLLKRPKN